MQSVFETLTIEQLAEPAFKTQFAADYTRAFAALAGAHPHELSSLDVQAGALVVSMAAVPPKETPNVSP